MKEMNPSRLFKIKDKSVRSKILARSQYNKGKRIMSLKNLRQKREVESRSKIRIRSRRTTSKKNIKSIMELIL